MIRVKVEMCPRGDESHDRTYEIGRMYIANAGGNVARGDYEVAVCRRGTTAIPAPIDPDGPKATRTNRVEGYPRLAYNMWRLIARAVLGSFPEERPLAAKAQAFDDRRDMCKVPSEEQALELGRELFEVRQRAWSDAHYSNPLETFELTSLGREAWIRGARPRCWEPRTP